MGIHHQAFNCKLIIFILFFILSIDFSYNQARAANYSLFVIKDVNVDVTAEDSVQAQDKAYAKAQATAFSILKKRMVADAQAENMSYPGFDTVASLVKDYEITEEKISAVRYVGTYTFRFREKAVSEFFSVSGVQYTEQSSKTLLVLPIFQRDGKNSIWSDGNLWMQAWGQVRLPGGLVPIEVPIGDLMDIGDIDDDNALRYARLKLDRMLGRYDAKEAAIMIAVPDVSLLSVRQDKDRAIGSLRISIYRTDRARAEHVKDITLKANDSETRSDIYVRAVQAAHTALQRDWKEKNMSSSAQSKLYHVRVPIGALKEWVAIKNKLNQVSALSDLSVVSMKKSDVRVSFNFRGDEAHLRSALARDALTLSRGYQNPNVQSFTENGRQAPRVLYNLHSGLMKKGKLKQPLNKVKPAAGVDSAEPSAQTHTF